MKAYIIRVRPSLKALAPGCTIMFLFTFIVTLLMFLYNEGELYLGSAFIVGSIGPSLLIFFLLPQLLFESITIESNYLIYQFPMKKTISLDINNLKSIYGTSNGKHSWMVFTSKRPKKTVSGIKTNKQDYRIELTYKIYLEEDLRLLTDKILEINPNVKNSFW